MGKGCRSQSGVQGEALLHASPGPTPAEVPLLPHQAQAGWGLGATLCQPLGGAFIHRLERVEQDLLARSPAPHPTGCRLSSPGPTEGRRAPPTPRPESESYFWFSVQTGSAKTSGTDRS